MTLDKNKITNLVCRAERALKVFRFYGKERTNCTMLCKEVLKREADNILEDILAIGAYLCRTRNKPDIVKIRYWYQDKGWTEIDNHIYKMWCHIAKNEFGVEGVDPMNFSGRCEQLVDDIFRLFGDRDFNAEKAMAAYIRVVIKQAMSWNKTLVYSPKSLLERRYGWGIWQKWVDENGLDDFIEDTKAVETIEKVRELDKRTLKERATALLNGDMLGYNKVLREMSRAIR